MPTWVGRKFRNILLSVSPVWITIWTLRLESVANLFPHVSQTNGRSSLWTAACFLKLVAVFVEYGQNVQLNLKEPNVSLWCHILCLDKVTCDENHFWHELQVNPERQPTENQCLLILLVEKINTFIYEKY